MPRRSAPPILEYPGDEPALIEPSRLYGKKPRVPPSCVLCFFFDVLQEQVEAGTLEPITTLPGEGEPRQVYSLHRNDQDVTVLFPGVGASFAASVLEEVIALGGRRFICAGGAGVLDSSIPVGRVIIPDAALRDEGTSYHYQREGRFSSPHPTAMKTLERLCRERGIEHLTGPTWTTDGVYRETAAKIRSRRAEGCLTVEMEAAAFFAVAAFRHVALGQLLYAGDDVSGDRWRHRGWLDQRGVRRELFDLAVDASLQLPDGDRPHNDSDMCAI